MGDADALARRLLDAQVDWVLGELSGKRFAKVVARDVDDVLAAAATVTLAEVVDADDVKELVRRVVENVGSAPAVVELVAALADAIYDLAASDEHRLGEVVERDPVVALIAKVLSMRELHERALDRLGDSPMATQVAVRFAGRIVGDFVQQNRARAERVPGMGSLLSLGSSAASKVKSASDKHLDGLIGGATDKGKAVALKATTSATRDLIKEGLLQQAALELWDLHADEPISELRAYLSQQDLRELALIITDIVVTARTKPYVGELLDECVDVIFDRYGERDVASLLPELGVDRDDLVADIVRFARPVIDRARRDGVLETQVRARLEPFYASKAFAAAVKPVPSKGK